MHIRMKMSHSRMRTSERLSKQLKRHDKPGLLSYTIRYRANEETTTVRNDRPLISQNVQFRAHANVLREWTVASKERTYRVMGSLSLFTLVGRLDFLLKNVQESQGIVQCADFVTGRACFELCHPIENRGAGVSYSSHHFCRFRL